MKTIRWLLGILGVLLALASTWQIRAASSGLEEIHVTAGSLPLTFIGPAGKMDGSRPLVLIGHGLAGSATVMRGFALTFAHAGYVTASWDFTGHGSNPNPLGDNIQYAVLLKDAENAQAEAQRRGIADMSRTAILGHSMGTGVALTYGQVHPDTAATIAVSPVGTRVTPQLPHDLLLMAGQLEPNFIASAQQRLAEAGGPGGDLSQGTARKLLVVPGVEHISILFSTTAHHAALQWLDGVFGQQPDRQPYTDLRVLWFGLGVLGTLLAAATLVPRAKEDEGKQADQRALWRRILALVGGPLAATLIFWLAGQAGVPLSTLLGLRVGGYVLAWFGLAGLITLLILWPRLPMPGLRSAAAGLLIFALLWFGVGLLGGMVWLPWLLIPRRLILWPLGSLLLSLWFLAFAQVMYQSSWAGKLGWWLLESAVITGCLILALNLSPELGFLMLILPVAPILLFLHIVPAIPQRGRWAIALSGSLFVAWMLAAIFPLA